MATTSRLNRQAGWNAIQVAVASFAAILSLTALNRTGEDHSGRFGSIEVHLRALRSEIATLKHQVRELQDQKPNPRRPGRN